MGFSKKIQLVWRKKKKQLSPTKRKFSARSKELELSSCPNLAPNCVVVELNDMAALVFCSNTWTSSPLSNNMSILEEE